MMKGLMFHQEQQQQQDQENMSNLTSSASADQASASSVQYFAAQPHELPPPPPPPKKKRNQPGNPDPDAEVIALSPKTLMATNRFLCEVCNKGFQRDQNLQLHRRGHNLPWKLKQRSSKDVIRKKVYVCPEVSCVHHEACRALGDLTGIKKHFCRKHGEKKWKCEKCSKRYAVQSDWKAHSKTCGTREYRCDCGTLFSRRDSFITHRAFCDALAEESARAISGGTGTGISNHPLISSNNSISKSNMSSPHPQLQLLHHQFSSAPAFPISSLLEPKKEQQLPLSNSPHFHLRPELPPWLAAPPPPPPPPLPMHHHHHHLSCSSPSSSHQDHHQFMTHIHDHQTGHLMSSPSSNPGLAGPTANLQAVVPSPSGAGGGAHFNNLSISSSGMIPSPHMSATALLQKAAQMGATMSSRSELQPPTSANSASLNNMVRPHYLHHQTGHVPSTTTTSSPTAFALNLSSSSGDHQDHLAQAITGNGTGDSDHHHGLFLHGLPSFGNHMTFEDHAHAFLGGTTGVLSSNRLESDEGGMTRDFLGLRPLSHTDILSMAAGLGNCVNTSRDQSQKEQWRQG